MDEKRQLIEGSRQFGLVLTDAAAARLSRLLDELSHWSRAYNLTSIRLRDEMLTRHLLDSLSVAPFLQGASIADAGTGAGFPGLPLAIALPQLNFHLIDSSQKKISFVTHAARVLELKNVSALLARVETLDAARLPVDTIVARAFAPLDRLLTQLAPLTGASTQVVAMKGNVPDSELAGVGNAWQLDDIHSIQVPGLNETRTIVVARRRPAAVPSSL